MDSDTRALFLKTYIWIFSGLGLIGCTVCGVLGVVVAAFVSAISTMVAIFLSDKIGAGVADTFYGTGKASRSLREQLSGELNQVRHHKMQERFDQALGIVDGVLDKDPDFPDALLLKGQILWEGFEDSAAAQGYFKRVMKVVPNKNETLHRWASNYYKELRSS